MFFKAFEVFSRVSYVFSKVFGTFHRFSFTDA